MRRRRKIGGWVINRSEEKLSFFGAEPVSIE